MESIAILVAALVLLVVAISWFDIHPFIALLVLGVLLGVALGMPTEKAVESLLDGFAGTLRWIGIVLVLGTVIGEILNVTGGSLRIADTILSKVGEERVPLTMMLTGYVVAIPVFVDVAYIMLQPVTESLAARSKRNILVVGLALAAGLTVAHGLIPPTPGPLAAAGILEARLGHVILINGFVAVFAATGGLLWAIYYCRNRRLAYDEKLQERLRKGELKGFESGMEMPGAFGAFTPILLPLVLIALGSFADAGTELVFSGILKVIGTPTIALFGGLVLAAFLLEREGRMDRLSDILNRSIEKAAVVIMITGAGGALGGVIEASEVGKTVSSVITDAGVPGLLLPFILAGALTTATGSLTVSVVTSSSIVAPLLGSLGLSPALAVALIGAGSFCVIHANASFFWLFSRLHEVPPSEVYRSLTLQSLCMALGGFVGVLILWFGGLG